jgi:thiamine-monophosphate kinase
MGAQGPGARGQGAELDLVAAITRSLGGAPGRVLTGPGDDAAVVRAGGVAVTSIDTVVDGVHFEMATHSPSDIGHKALATALSDIAAMGAEAGEAFVSLALPEGFGRADALELVAAMHALAARQGVAIAGGDVVSAPTLAVTVSVTGWSNAPERLLYRSGAKAGDIVGVTGELGGSAAGLLLLGGCRVELAAAEREGLLGRHRRPEPLVATGLALAGAGVRAAIDLSDGLATDASHLASASGVEIELRLADLPLATGVAAVAEACGRDPHELAATGGDDYELLFTAAPASRAGVERAAAATGARVTWVGDVGAGGAGLVLRGAGGGLVELRGYEHG